VDLKLWLEGFLAVPRPKALEFALLAFCQSGSLFLLSGCIVLHKTTVYENEPINRHQSLLLPGSDQRLFPTTIIKERNLFSIVMPVPELQV